MEIIQEYWQYAIAIMGFMGLLGIEVKKDLKIYPITFIARVVKFIFKPLRFVFGIEDIQEQVHKLEEKVDEVVKKTDKLEMDNDFKDINEIKNKIANYAALLIEEPLTLCQYTIIWKLEERYLFYVDKYSYLPKGKRPNGELSESLRYIKKCFENGKITNKDYTKEK